MPAPYLQNCVTLNSGHCWAWKRIGSNNFLDRHHESHLNDIGDDAASQVCFSEPPPVTQATTWELMSPSGSKPSARRYHIAGWSDAANGFYIHGGRDGSSAGAQEVRRGGEGRLRGRLDELWFFSREARCVDGRLAWSYRGPFLGLKRPPEKLGMPGCQGCKERLNARQRAMTSKCLSW